MRLLAAIVAGVVVLAIGIAVSLFVGHDAGIALVASFVAALAVGGLTALLWPRSR